MDTRWCKTPKSRRHFLLYNLMLFKNHPPSPWHEWGNFLSVIIMKLHTVSEHILSVYVKLKQREGLTRGLTKQRASDGTKFESSWFVPVSEPSLSFDQTDITRWTLQCGFSPEAHTHNRATPGTVTSVHDGAGINFIILKGNQGHTNDCKTKKQTCFSFWGSILCLNRLERLHKLLVMLFGVT